MKMIVVTTITSTLDVESMTTAHDVEVEDQDNLSGVSTQILGSLILGGLNATENSLREKFHIPKNMDPMDED